MNKLDQVSNALIYAAATVAGVVVGVLQFLYRAWHSNDVGTKLSKAVEGTANVIQSTSSAIINEFRNQNPSSVRNDELGTVLDGGLPEDSNV
jgi:hypothetical protein